MSSELAYVLGAGLGPRERKTIRGVTRCLRDMAEALATADDPMPGDLEKFAVCTCLADMLDHPDLDHHGIYPPIAAIGTEYLQAVFKFVCEYADYYETGGLWFADDGGIEWSAADFVYELMQHLAVECSRAMWFDVQTDLDTL